VPVANARALAGLEWALGSHSVASQRDQNFGNSLPETKLAASSCQTARSGSLSRLVIRTTGKVRPSPNVTLNRSTGVYPKEA